MQMLERTASPTTELLITQLEALVEMQDEQIKGLEKLAVTQRKLCEHRGTLNTALGIALAASLIVGVLT